jgi:diguanylate cyclase (GGDEF)-like protein
VRTAATLGSGHTPESLPASHMPTPHLQQLSRLRGFLEVTRLVRGEDELDDLLAAIARAISTSLGYATVAVHLYRPAWNDFAVTTVHGGDEARGLLMSDTRPAAMWEPLLDERFACDGAFLIPHGEFDWATYAPGSYVPDTDGRDEDDAWHPEDALFVPLRHSDGHLIGILSVDEPESGMTPRSEELEVLVAMADHAAIAVQSAQEAAAAARHRAALEQLLAVSSRLTETFSIDAILESVCGAIHTALEFESVCIDLPEPDTGLLRARAAHGWAMSDAAVAVPMSRAELELLFQPEFEIEGCYLLEHDKAMRVLPSEHDTYHSQVNGTGPEAWRNHWLIVPLWSRSGGLMGVIWADDPVDRLIPSDAKLQALRVFANQATTALDTAAQYEEMQFLAEHDPLTRLYNRRAFSDRLELESARATRYGSPMSLVLCDLNGFKALNDTHGHAAGDAALEQIGTILRSGLRRADAAYRIGGDEFALILPETSADDAAGVAGRVSTAMAAAFTGNMAGLGASFGVSVCPADGTTPEALFRAADAAMYAAKRPGEGFALPRAS